MFPGVRRQVLQAEATARNCKGKVGSFVKDPGKSTKQGSGLRKAVVLAAGIPLLFGSVTAAPAAVGAPAGNSAVTQQKAPHVNPKDYPDGRYIVVLKAEPVATYDGGVAGIAATKPSKGKKLDADAKNVQKYQKHLTKQQEKVANSKDVTIETSFTAAVNGFSAELTSEKAVELAKHPSVLMVAPDTENAPTYSSMDYLGLPGGQGAWKKEFDGRKNAGKGVVVGIIDTGYSPDNPFFKGKKVKPLKGNQQPKVGQPYLNSDGDIAMLKADGETFIGQCQVGEDFDGSACNSKVLSAQYFADTFVEYVPEESRAPQERLSPIDVGSHGTHTASTAAGNANVEQTIGERSFGNSSGVAPEAKLSIYKTCWEDTDPNTGGCYSSATIAAVNAAILDGVDVLNYSISGTTSTTTDPVSLAFLSATSAGIFVAASGGNSGPTASTVNHGAPWVTTVAASTFSHALQGTAEFSDGSKFRGASIMAGSVPESPVSLSTDLDMEGADGSLCEANTLDPEKTAGKVVVCDRGVIARADKSAEVARAGGIGMILVNLTDSSMDADQHSIPTVHVNAPQSLALKEKVATNPDITVSLIPEDTTGDPLPPVPQVAGFSSRGPLEAVESDLLKPDISAPGVAVLAGVSPIGADGENFGFMSGTSMASPHVAGLGALILGSQPTWSPAVVKSAMMTTAGDLVKADGTKDRDLFATGAGEIQPADVMAPGLVYDAGVNDYLKFIQGTGVDLGIPDLGSTAPRDMNVPSFALGNLAGKITVTRTVTALNPGIYRATADVPGVNVTVTPSVLNFTSAGEKRTFKVTFENNSAALGEFAMGSLAWQGAGKTVTSPIAVRPQAIVAPDNAAFSGGSDGSGTISVKSGTNAPIDVALEGLSKADSTDIALVPGPVAFESNEANQLKQVTVPEGSPLAKFSLLSSDDAADFDLFIINPQGQLQQVATASASESVTIENPIPGTYTLVANLYASPNGVKTAASLDAAILGADEGNATVSPDPLTLSNGESGDLTLTWKGLEAGSYVGRVTYEGSDQATFVTVVVDGTSGLPALELPELDPTDKLPTGPRESITPTSGV